MRRGTTPAIVLSVDMDLIGWHVYVTLKSRNNILTLDNGRLNMELSGRKTIIAFPLTQAETLAFSPGKCKVQVRAVHDGTAIASDIGEFEIDSILQQGIIHDI